MKYKLIFCCVALLSFSSGSKAGSGAFDNGTSAINLGLGVGGYYGGYYNGLSGKTESPLINFSFEHLQWDAGPGVISWGLYSGFKTIRYEQHYGWGWYKQSWNYVIVGVRAAWHWTEIPVEKLDVYGGVMAGLYFSSYKYKSSDPYYDTIYDNYNDGAALYPSLFVGGRYMFAENFGAFAEAGYGASVLSVGITFKF